MTIHPRSSVKLRYLSKNELRLRHYVGFTLIELMIVIVIISIIATFGVLSIKVNEKKQLETIADQLVNTITLAEQEALLRPATLGMHVSFNKLRFYIYQPTINKKDEKENPWQLLKGSILNNTSPLPADIHLTLKKEEEKAEHNENQPQIIMTAGGDLTPFTLFIGKTNSDPLYKIIGEENGKLTVSTIDETE